MKEEELGRKFPKNLNCVTAVKFKVNQRAMRKRFDFLLGRSRQQSREEAKACGACLEPTELDVLLEEMSEREKLAESTRESCSSKSVETDRKKDEEKRCQALIIIIIIIIIIMIIIITLFKCQCILALLC